MVHIKDDYIVLGWLIFIMRKKNLLFLTIVFAGTSLLTGCGKSSGSTVNKLIGYIIKQDDSETFEREDGYIYGLVANFYVYNYEENYLPVYSLEGVDYEDCIAIQAGVWGFFEYISIGTNEEISLKI